MPQGPADLIRFIAPQLHLHENFKLSGVTRIMTETATGTMDTELQSESFVDRRKNLAVQAPIFERRQFANSHRDLSPEAAELALAIDGYKLQHRRRFITYEEIFEIVKSLGYHK
jgi:hypothetical protein